MSQRDSGTPVFPAELFTMSEIGKQSCPWKDERIKRITIKYYSALKSKEIQLLVKAWMNLEDITLNEIGPTQKDKYCVTSLICGVQRRQTHRPESSRVVPGLGGRDGESWGKGHHAAVTRMSQSKISCTPRCGESQLF